MIHSTCKWESCSSLTFRAMIFWALICLQKFQSNWSVLFLVFVLFPSCNVTLLNISIKDQNFIHYCEVIYHGILLIFKLGSWWHIGSVRENDYFQESREKILKITKNGQKECKPQITSPNFFERGGLWISGHPNATVLLNLQPPETYKIFSI